jgi:hypothetical protein
MAALFDQMGEHAALHQKALQMNALAGKSVACALFAGPNAAFVGL